MFAAYIIVTVLAAAANLYAATNDFTRPQWLLANMTKVGVPESWLTPLGVLKAAGAVGLLVGIGVPWIGTAAAVGLTLFFVGALITHLRARDYSFGNGVPVMFLILAVAALLFGLYARPTQASNQRGEKEEAVAEALIRQRVEDGAKAIRAKDIDGVMSLYASNIVSFDLNPPLRYVGANNKRRAWQEAFAAYTGPIVYEVRELNVTTHGELAFVHSLNHVKGTLASGHISDLWLRWTACFRRIDDVLAGCARPRVSPSRPRAWPGCSESHTLSSLSPF